MAIIVETGAGIAGANSYNSDAEYTAYATARGIIIGADLAVREIELIKATDYVDNELTKFRNKTYPTQSLRFPQKTAYIDGVLIPPNSIPNELKRAQLEAAISVFSGELGATATASNIKSEQLGTLKTEYFEGATTTPAGSSGANTYLDMIHLGVELAGFGNVYRG